MVGVLRSAKSGLHNGEAGLHEHDQEPGHERPHEVNGDAVLPRLIHRVGQRHAFGGVGRNDVVDRAGLRSAGIALC